MKNLEVLYELPDNKQIVLAIVDGIASTENTVRDFERPEYCSMGDHNAEEYYVRWYASIDTLLFLLEQSALSGVIIPPNIVRTVVAHLHKHYR